MTTIAESLKDIPTAATVTAEALRRATNALLRECTEQQVALFNKIHDSAPYAGWLKCPPAKLAESYDLVRRTVARNRAGKTSTVLG